MAYPFSFYGNPGQPFQYQDQLNQLRTAPMPNQYAPMPTRPDPSGLNWVQGEAGAKSWIVTPGATVLLMDAEAMRFYIKAADANGVPTMRTFEYTEIGTRPQEPGNFVTVDVFNEFKSEVMSKLSGLTEKGEENG